jgi:hypothetical protein
MILATAVLPIRDPVPYLPMDPRSGMNKKSRSGSWIRIRDEYPGSYFRELIKFFGLKMPQFFDADTDPG